jgi:hypothetical protein
MIEGCTSLTETLSSTIITIGLGTLSTSGVMSPKASGGGVIVGFELQGTLVNTPSTRTEMIRALERETASSLRFRMFFKCTLKKIHLVQYRPTIQQL